MDATVLLYKLAYHTLLWPVHLILGEFEFPFGTLLVMAYVMLLRSFTDDTAAKAITFPLFFNRFDIFGDAFWAGVLTAPLGLLAWALGAKHAAAALLLSPIGGTIYAGTILYLLDYPSMQGLFGSTALEAAVSALGPVAASALALRLNILWAAYAAVSGVLAALLWERVYLEYMMEARTLREKMEVVADILEPLVKKTGDVEFAIELARHAGLLRDEEEVLREVLLERLWRKRRW